MAGTSSPSLPPLSLPPFFLYPNPLPSFFPPFLSPSLSHSPSVDKRHGQGIMLYLSEDGATKEKYEGEWQEGG